MSEGREQVMASSSRDSTLLVMRPTSKAKLIVGLDIVLITSGVGAVLLVLVLCLQLARDGVTLW